MEENDLSDGVHKRKAESSNKENENNEHRSIETRRRRRSDDYEASKSSQSRMREEGKRRQSESNPRRRQTPEAYKSESSLDYDHRTPSSTYKSASERITDEHIASSPMIQESPRNRENTSEEIIWPTWISSMTISSPPKELEDLLRRQKMRKQRQREEILHQLSSPAVDTPSNFSVLQDACSDIDVTGIRSAKAVLIGDGWRLLKDGRKMAIIGSQFRSASESATDPRSSSYRMDLEQRISHHTWEKIAL